MDTVSSLQFSEQLPAAGEYWELFQTTGWNEEYGFTQSDLERALQGSWFALAVYEGGRLIGFGRIIADGVHHALIVDLIVHPERQGRGIGAHLLDRLVAKCREHRIRDIQLFAAAGKYGFYEKHGFRKRPGDAPGMQYGGA